MNEQTNEQMEEGKVICRKMEILREHLIQCLYFINRVAEIPEQLKNI